MQRKKCHNKFVKSILSDWPSVVTLHLLWFSPLIKPKLQLPVSVRLRGHMAMLSSMASTSALIAFLLASGIWAVAAGPFRHSGAFVDAEDGHAYKEVHYDAELVGGCGSASSHLSQGNRETPRVSLRLREGHEGDITSHAGFSPGDISASIANLLSNLIHLNGLRPARSECRHVQI